MNLNKVLNKIVFQKNNLTEESDIFLWEILIALEFDRHHNPNLRSYN